MEKSESSQSLEKLFEEVINIRGIHHELEMNEATVRSLRKRFTTGGVTVERMREVLSKLGYQKVQEERWGR